MVLISEMIRTAPDKINCRASHPDKCLNGTKPTEKLRDWVNVIIYVG